MYFVYIVKCQNHSYYVGMTRRLHARILGHNAGNTKSTKWRLPVKLIWFCGFPDKHTAALFEQYLKSHSGKAFLQKRLVKVVIS